MTDARFEDGGEAPLWAELVSDEMLHTIVACGTPAEVAVHVRERVQATDGMASTVCVYQAAPIAPELLGEVVAELRAPSTPSR